ncbi:helix-turn-helix transcriptional regulator [Streptomyces shenzhenensis]|uniref:helix-turn-helix domain-containing protein n=1 Tax=Streptomyces shenzhenensis TaxID=943815 RepID=UPI0033C3D8DC
MRLRIDAERDLRTVGVRRPSASFTGSESLTGSERRVAELAARGHTNTEISHLLQVTRRTVESHLTRSYSKLGINAAGTSCGRLCAGWRRTRDTGRLTPGPQPRPASLGPVFQGCARARGAGHAPASRIRHMSRGRTRNRLLATAGWCPTAVRRWLSPRGMWCSEALATRLEENGLPREFRAERIPRGRVREDDAHHQAGSSDDDEARHQ